MNIEKALPTDLMVQGLRPLWLDPDSTLATKCAISQARYRLGARPVVALFHQVCRPLARTPDAGHVPLWLAPDGPGRNGRGRARDVRQRPGLLCP
jgi:hypothetical protein